MSDSVPKDDEDVDGTLTAVLDLIKFRNANHRKLTQYSIKPTKVELTFQPVAPPKPAKAPRAPTTPRGG